MIQILAACAPLGLAVVDACSGAFRATNKKKEIFGD